MKKMSKTESEVMEVLWNLKEPIVTNDLLTFFNDKRNKNWKIQTLSTFLNRLYDKGLVDYKPKGRGYMYWPAITKNEYHQKLTKRFLDEMYNGSVKNFLSALIGKNKLSDDDIDDLKKWLNER